MAPPDAAIPGPEPPRLHLADLLRGAREALIEHGGEVYRLRLTSKGKLLLTK